MRKQTKHKRIVTIKSETSMDAIEEQTRKLEDEANAKDEDDGTDSITHQIIFLGISLFISILTMILIAYVSQ